MTAALRRLAYGGAFLADGRATALPFVVLVASVPSWLLDREQPDLAAVASAAVRLWLKLSRKTPAEQDSD